MELEPVIFFYKESKSKIKKWVLGGMCVCVFFFWGGGGGGAGVSEFFYYESILK